MYNELSFLHGGTTTKNKSRETKRKKEWGSFDFPSRCSLLFWLVLLTIGAEAAGTHGSLSAGISWARRQKEVVQLLRKRKGGREVNEDQMRPPRHKRRWEAKMATVAGEGPCGVHLRLIYHRGNGGSSLYSPPHPYKSNERLSGPFSLLKFLRPNLQCDWSPVTDRTNIRPTVISFLFSFSGWCYCCW